MRALRSLSLIVSAVAAPVLAGCTAPEPAASGRYVTSAWARPADSGATSGAYLTIRNADSAAVELVAVSSPLAVAAEVHETMQHNGMAHMMARTTVGIAPRDSLVMKPGGLHVMLVHLTRALVVGDTIPVLLRFSNGDSLTARVPVKEG